MVSATGYCMGAPLVSGAAWQSAAAVQSALHSRARRNLWRHRSIGSLAHRMVLVRDTGKALGRLAAFVATIARWTVLSLHNQPFCRAVAGRQADPACLCRIAAQAA
jgi:hypothetical protein